MILIHLFSITIELGEKLRRNLSVLHLKVVWLLVVWLLVGSHSTVPVYLSSLYHLNLVPMCSWFSGFSHGTHTYLIPVEFTKFKGSCGSGSGNSLLPSDVMNLVGQWNGQGILRVPFEPVSTTSLGRFTANISKQKNAFITIIWSHYPQLA